MYTKASFLQMERRGRKNKIKIVHLGEKNTRKLLFYLYRILRTGMSKKKYYIYPRHSNVHLKEQMA
jgi:hypothetical protein